MKRDGGKVRNISDASSTRAKLMIRFERDKQMALTFRWKFIVRGGR